MKPTILTSKAPDTRNGMTIAVMMHTATGIAVFQVKYDAARYTSPVHQAIAENGAAFAAPDFTIRNYHITERIVCGRRLHRPINCIPGRYAR